MTRRPVPASPSPTGLNSVVTGIIMAIEYAIVGSLLVVSGIVLVRTMITFFDSWSSFPSTVVGAIDGILVVIILLDIVHTVFDHIRSWEFTVRPFLVIAVLAGVRDILSTSARLALSHHLSSSSLEATLVSLAVGVGVVLALLSGLVILRFTGHTDEE